MEVKTLGIYFLNQFRLTIFPSSHLAPPSIELREAGSEGVGWGDIGRSRWKKVEGGDGIGS